MDNIEESQDTIINATTGELEELNGLLVRRLIEKVKDGTASSTDLSTAMHLMRTHRVQPTDPAPYRADHKHDFHDLDFPVKV